NAPVFVKLVESSVGISLQRAPELPQVPRGVLAFAIRRIGKPHGGARPDLLSDDHREHTSTAAPSWSCRCPAPALAPVCRRRAVCRPRSRSGAALPPAAPATAPFRPPSRPASSAPTPHRDARKSPTGGRAASESREGV